MMALRVAKLHNRLKIYAVFIGGSGGKFVALTPGSCVLYSTTQLISKW